MPQELKPCPYCGNRELGKEAYGAEVWIQCHACEMRGPTTCSQVVDHTESIKARNALPRTLTWITAPPKEPASCPDFDWLTAVETAARGDMAGDPEATKRLDELGPAAVILRLVEIVRETKVK